MTSDSWKRRIIHSEPTNVREYRRGNSYELIQKLQRIERMSEDEFRKESIWELKRWLNQFESAPEWARKVRIYANLARLCMNENYFTLRDKFCKTASGVTQGLYHQSKKKLIWGK